MAGRIVLPLTVAFVIYLIIPRPATIIGAAIALTFIGLIEFLTREND